MKLLYFVIHSFLAIGNCFEESLSWRHCLCYQL